MDYSGISVHVSVWFMMANSFNNDVILEEVYCPTVLVLLIPLEKEKFT